MLGGVLLRMAWSMGDKAGFAAAAAGLLLVLAAPSAGSRPLRFASSRAVEPHTSLRVDGG